MIQDFNVGALERNGSEVYSSPIYESGDARSKNCVAEMWFAKPQCYKFSSLLIMQTIRILMRELLFFWYVNLKGGYNEAMRELW